MARRRKSLRELVEHGTFLARRASDRSLLLGDALPWPAFQQLQARFAAASSEPERRAVALEVERLVKQAQQELQRRQREAGDRGQAALAAQLAQFGRAGSLKQLLGFFPGALVHAKGPLLGQPFQLAGFQQRFLREFYRRDNDGRRVYRSGTLGLSRGQGKTPIAAALGLYELITRTDAPEIYCAAASKEQASIALGFAKSFVEDSPLLSHWVQLGSKLLCPSTRGVMQVISSEGRMQHGRMPAVAIIDELWAFTTKREQEAYTALSSALHKRDDSFLLAITTAGYDKNSLLGQIYTAALGWPDVEALDDGYLLVCRDIATGQLLWWHGAPEGAAVDDPAVWRKANPGRWISTDALRKQLADPGLDENEFRRLNLNQWTKVKDSWLPTGLWPHLSSEERIPEGADVYLGVDIGIYHDTSAVCWAHRLPDGRIILRCRVWAADRDAPAHHHLDGPVEIGRIEQFITDKLAPKFRIRELVFDPIYFRRSAEILERRGFTMVEFLAGSAPLRDAYQLFFQLAREGKLTHDGDPVLAAHIENTAAYKTERGWRLAKLNNSGRIDATVACVLAVARATHHQPSHPDIRWIEL